MTDAIESIRLDGRGQSQESLLYFILPARLRDTHLLCVQTCVEFLQLDRFIVFFFSGILLRIPKRSVPRIGETFYSSVMELKIKLQNLMARKGLNGQKLARLSQVSDSEISRILQGKSRPGLDNALRLAQAVGVPLDYLADEKLDAEPDEPADSLSPEERKVLSIVQKIGCSEVLTILENVRFLGYEVAMSRLVGAKPVIEIDKDGTDVRAPLATQAAMTARANSASA
jgi:transcriptional regulator with XRE-family HTH domain